MGSPGDSQIGAATALFLIFEDDMNKTTFIGDYLVKIVEAKLRFLDDDRAKMLRLATPTTMTGTATVER